MNMILVASYRSDISEHYALAMEYGCGLEIQAFSNPNVLDNDWRTLLGKYKALLRDFTGPISCHGAFFDMTSASVDRRVVALSRERYLLNLDIATELGATHVVFHTNFLPMIRTERYRQSWIAGQLEFWTDFAPEAQKRGISIGLENMWDPDPFLLRDLFARLTTANMGVCLDISHAYLYRADADQSVETWVEILAPYIIHVHMNNTRGWLDEHMALDALGGAVNYQRILPQLMALETHPWLVIEIDEPVALAQSLTFLRRTLNS